MFLVEKTSEKDIKRNSAFCKILITVTGSGSTLNGVQIVRLAENSVFNQSKLFTGGQLSATLIAGKTG